MEEKLKLFLRSMIGNEGSDLHLKSGAIPRVRIHGILRLLGKDVLSAEDVDGVAREIMTQEQYIRLKADKNLDFSYVLGDEHRFRVNFFSQGCSQSI